LGDGGWGRSRAAAGGMGMGDDQAVMKEFLRLFWEARELQMRKRSAQAKEAYEKAGEYAREHGLAGEGRIVAAAKLQTEGKLEEAGRELEEVLKDPSLKARGLGRFVAGSVQESRKEYDAAIGLYEAGAADAGFDRPGTAWNNMGIAYAGKKEYDRAIECYRKALETEGYDTPGDAWNNMGNAYSGKKEYDKAMECYRKALETEGYDTPGNAWNNMGNAYSGKKEYDKAIECYRKALETEGYDTPGDGWYNMGSAYGGKKEYDKAIECYRKALETEGYDTPGDAWNNMGVAYSDKKEYDKAIECHRKALETEGYDTPGHAWYNMGNAYSNKKEYDKAIDRYRKALETEGFGSPGAAWHNMGAAYALKNEYDRAIECWKEASAIFEKAGDGDWAARARAMIEIVKIPAEERRREDRVEVGSVKVWAGERGKESVEERMRGKLERAKEDRYQRYEKEKGSDFGDVLAILRGWGSAVSLVEGPESACRGGGYFLKWRGKGMVIDPGFDFLRNFHEQGFHCREINAVAVSHNHTDHNHDLRFIDDVRYEMWKRAAEEKKGEWRYAVLWDGDTEKNHRFDPEKASYRREPIKMDLAWANAGKDYIVDLQELEGLPFRVRFFKAEHAEEVPGAVGLRVECLREKKEERPVVVGFSGDTGFFEELCDEKHLGGCDILVAHVSQPDPEEWGDEEHLKKGHLGYRGLAKLVKRAKAGMVIVGEFWAGLADLRIDLVQGIRERSGVKEVWPGSIGMMVRPGRNEMRCSSCGKWVGVGEVAVGSAGVAMGALSYLCGECRL